MMSSGPAVTLSGLAAQAYSIGYDFHGEIDLQPEAFERHLRLIIDKHLGSGASATAQLSFAGTLRTTDLYLTVACAQPTEAAWRRFSDAYQKYIDAVARYVSPAQSVARELAENVLADLFLPDSSGVSRIASFDGRQSLATWLRVLISRRAINHGLLKWNGFERVEPSADVEDKASVDRIEAAVRRSRYQTILNDSFKQASDSLTDRERLILLLRYDDGLGVGEVARLLGVHPSGVTRQFHHLHLKLQIKIVSILAGTYHLGPEAIKECLADVIENPAHSLLVFLKAS